MESLNNLLHNQNYVKKYSKLDFSLAYSFGNQIFFLKKWLFDNKRSRLKLTSLQKRQLFNIFVCLFFIGFAFLLSGKLSPVLGIFMSMVFVVVFPMIAITTFMLVVIGFIRFVYSLFLLKHSQLVFSVGGKNISIVSKFDIRIFKGKIFLSSSKLAYLNEYRFLKDKERNGYILYELKHESVNRELL